MGQRLKVECGTELLVTRQMTQDDSPKAPASGPAGSHPALATAPYGAGGAAIAVRGCWQGLAHPVHTPAGPSALPLGGAALGREVYRSEVRPGLRRRGGRGPVGWGWAMDSCI